MFWSDLSQLTGAVLLMIGALLPVVNPLGDAPVFLGVRRESNFFGQAADLAGGLAGWP